MESPPNTVVQFRSTSSALLKPDQHEARRAPRHRVLKSGIVATNDRHLTMGCTVRDLSDTGARIRVESSLSVPDTFELIIEMDGLEANCQVVWRNGKEVGVKYLGAPRKVAARRVQVINALVPPSSPSLRRRPKPPA
jgi:hypothetical protein